MHQIMPVIFKKSEIKKQSETAFLFHRPLIGIYALTFQSIFQIMKSYTNSSSLTSVAGFLRLQTKPEHNGLAIDSN